MAGEAAATESPEAPPPRPPVPGPPAWRDRRVLLASLGGALLGVTALLAMAGPLPRTARGTWNAILFGAVPGGLAGAYFWVRAGAGILGSGPALLLRRLLRPAPAPPAPLPFGRTFLLWTGFCVPVLYAANLLSTLAHEVLGHGLTALRYGGWFRGILVHPWGGGMALCDAPGFDVQVLAAGSAAEVVMGLLLLLAAGRRAPGGPGRVGLLLVAMIALTGPYAEVFLAGFLQDPGSDFARILEEREAARLRGPLAVVGAAGFVASLWAVGRWLLREADLAFGGGGPLRGWRRHVAAQLFVALPGAWWIVLAIQARANGWQGPHLPWACAGAFLAHGVVAVALCLLPRWEPAGAPAAPPRVRSWLLAWSMGAGLYLCAQFWWSDLAWLF